MERTIEGRVRYDGWNAGSEPFAILWEDGRVERTNLQKVKKGLLPEGAERVAIAMTVRDVKILPDRLDGSEWSRAAVANLVASVYTVASVKDEEKLVVDLNEFRGRLTSPGWAWKQIRRSELMMEAMSRLKEVLTVERGAMWRWYDLLGDAIMASQFGNWFKAEMSAPSLELKRTLSGPLRLIEPGVIRRALSETGARAVMTCPWRGTVELVLGVIMGMTEVRAAFVLAEAVDVAELSAGMRETLATGLRVGVIEAVSVEPGGGHWMWIMILRDEGMREEVKTKVVDVSTMWNDTVVDYL
jgi:hypothetical protein